MNTPPLHPRRDFLAGISSGFAGVALSQLLARNASASVPVPRSEFNGGIHHLAKVKRVIQLFMNGGVSPMDTWDRKLATSLLRAAKER